MTILPEIGTRWFDHDRSMVWWIHMVAWPEHQPPEITISYADGEKMGFELVSPDIWAERVADGRYELVVG